MASTHVSMDHTLNGCLPNTQPITDPTSSVSSLLPPPRGHIIPDISPAPPIEIKIFVGRVPKDVSEEQLMPLFEQYGNVKECCIIRDKQTNNHKCSAFIKMASISQADAIIQTLNAKAAEEGPNASSTRLQVKYATGEAEKLGLIDATASEPGVYQAKVFVGSLPREMTEEQIRNLFSLYGTIEEVFIMTDKPSGVGKGCAFVKFAFKEQAFYAIKCMDGKHTIEGCSRPVEVRLAECKAQRQQLNNSMTQHMVSNPYANLSNHQMNMIVQGPVVAVAPSNSAPRACGPWKEYWTKDNRPYYYNEQTKTSQWCRPQEFNAPPIPMSTTIQQSQMVGTDATGPKGANIFIFYVPNEWSQADLLNAFSAFGNIVSARIASDKASGRNKGYAFVSYDSPQSAAYAVHNMNGFVALSKRLKVTIKKGEESYVQHYLDQLENQAQVAATVGIGAGQYGAMQPTTQYGHGMPRYGPY